MEKARESCTENRLTKETLLGVNQSGESTGSTGLIVLSVSMYS